VTVALYTANNGVMQALFHGGGQGYGIRNLLLQMALYLFVTGCIFVAYRQVLSMCSRGELVGRARLCAVAIPCVLSVLLVVWTPSLSEDVFSYMAHGFLGVIPGSNPLLRPADAAAHTAIGPSLAAFGWHGEIGITPYGIVWTQIEVTIMKLSGIDVPTALILLKSVVAAASLATAFFIWVFLGAVRPSCQLFGTLAYLWNPLILAEFAGEGHNDAVMVLFVVAGLAACATRRPTASMIAQLLGFLTKYVSILFFPAQLIYLWRLRRSAGQLALDVLIALVTTAAIAAILYAPLWAGVHSFDGLLQRGQPMSSASPFGAVNWVLRRSPLAAHAGPLTLALVTLPLLGFIAWISLRVKDAVGLARAFAWISVVYALLTSPDYWPWYVCMPVALLIMADVGELLWLIMLLSITARLCAPLDLIRDHGFLSMVVAKATLTGVCTTVPFVVLVVWMYRKRGRLPAIFA